MSTRVLLVDEHEITRQGVCSLCEEEGDIEVVAESADGRTAIALVSKHLPDIVVTEIHLPNLNGVEATRQIRDREPSVKVVVLSVCADQRSVAIMIQAGASGYVLKKAAACEVIEAVWAVLAGRKYVSAQLIDPLITDYAQYLADAGGEPPFLTALVVDPENEQLIENHLAALIAETDGELYPSDESILGSAFYNKAKENGGRPPRGYNPHPRLNMRGGIGPSFKLKRGNMFVIPADRFDTSTYSKTNDNPTAYYYENYSGGIGVARKLFEVWKQALRKGIEIAGNCECGSGCQNCIEPAKSYNISNEDIDKVRGIELANNFLAAVDRGPDHEFRNGRMVPL